MTLRFGAICIGITALVWSAAPAVGPIVFDDMTTRSLVKFVAHSDPTPQKHQPEMMVAGVAVFDYDGDGYPDIYLVNGGSMPGLVKEGPEYWNRLFHNNGNFTFADVTEKAGVAGAGYGMGVAIGDYDNDGRPDIYVTAVNGNQLFHNNGDGTFTDVTAKAAVSGGTLNGKKMWSAAAAWLDYNNDGLLDLFVSNYCDWDPATEHACVLNGSRVYCNPRFYRPLPNTLYRNNGDGTFTDVSQETGISTHLGRGMGIGIADFDGDGYPDIFVANDDSPNQLFHNRAGRHFDEIAQETMTAYTQEGSVISGMGADFEDVFNKGAPDIWVTAMEKESFPLFINQKDGQFSEATAAAGLALSTTEMSGWSNAILDLDNDGWKDLLVARSNVIDNVALFSPRSFDEPNAVFRNLGNGRFQDVSKTAGPAFQVSAVHRGLAFGDLDNDGRLDAVFSVLNGQARVLRNTSSNRNHWICLNLIGTRSNRMAIGATIRLTSDTGQVQYGHVSTSTGYASSSDPRVHFGLGRSAYVKQVEIQWPSGMRQVLRNLPTDRIINITEPRP